MLRARIGQALSNLPSAALLALLLVSYVALVFVSVVTVGALLLGDMVSAKYNPPWLLTLIALALLAVSFRPVYRWLRDHVNELLYAGDDNPYALIARVNDTLQAMVAPQVTLPAVAETVARALNLPYVAIDMGDAVPHWSCAFGSPSAGAEISAVPIVYLDRRLGTLRASGRGSRQPLFASDLALLRDVAQQLGIALHAAQLTAEVQTARERLVLAREEERRRIRNDLHDGLAPTLSSLQLQLGALRRQIRQDPAQAETIAAELGDDLRNATGAIRQLVYDLRPPMLDELQLVGALKSLRFPGSDIHFMLQAPDPMPDLPAAVEVALYRIASEAMHNVVKHAQAAECTVRIEAGDGRLTLRVQDDGVSLPAELTAGVGIHSMRERAEELGGTLSIQPGAQGGTEVLAQFPVQFEHG